MHYAYHSGANAWPIASRSERAVRLLQEKPLRPAHYGRRSGWYALRKRRLVTKRCPAHRNTVRR
jgi:hypothetical protein